MKSIFKSNTPLFVYREVSDCCDADLKSFAAKLGLTNCFETFIMPVKNITEPCNWHDYKPNEQTVKVSSTGIIVDEYGVGLMLREYDFLKKCQEHYSLEGKDFVPVIYMAPAEAEKELNTDQAVYGNKIVLNEELHAESMPEFKGVKPTEIIPESVDPDLWNYLTPEQKRLW